VAISSRVPAFGVQQVAMASRVHTFRAQISVALQMQANKAHINDLKMTMSLRMHAFGALKSSFHTI
jgi:hypothetical protein